MPDDSTSTGSPGAGDSSKSDDTKADPKGQTNPDAGGNGDGGDAGQSQGQTFDADYVAKLRKEAAAHRTRAQAAEAALKAHEDKDKPELAKLQEKVTQLEAERAEWERERKAAKVTAVFAVAASKAGATYPDAVGRLIDPQAIEWGSDGEILNAPELVKSVKERYPQFFTRNPNGSADGGAGNGSKTQDASMNTLIRRAAGRS